MELKNLLKYPIQSYAALRSLHYFIQFQTLSRLTHALPFIKTNQRPIDKAHLQLLAEEVKKLVQRESENIQNGVYPIQVYKPESFLEHSLRVPLLFWDGIQLNLRKNKKDSKSFSDEALKELRGLPEYYSRNFHFQTDGYLSEKSAEIYEHQVELLFAGMADSMRRLFLPELKRLLPQDQSGFNFLELGCGTGRTSRFMKLTFPDSHIVATDLSSPYLKVAQKKLLDLKKIDFLQCDAADLPFKPESFDVVYSVYLFHELPYEQRKQVLQQAWQALKPKGYIAFVDSLQLNDKPEFNPFLENFPKDFHEPFYTNYIQHPLEDLIKETGFKLQRQGTGFLSKYWIAQKD